MTAGASPSHPAHGAGGDQLVSVVVPAFNAERTLDATLRSARGQTHRNIEIVVVDDGSTDDTRGVAESHARQDARIRLVSTANRGVAHARNTGVEAAGSELISPLDSDDLWHPEKLARQLAVLNRGGPEMGFVYAGFRIIDGGGKVVATPPLRRCDGRVFLRSVLVNLVGNGSGLLARREALRSAGGYSEELRRRGLEGTEDRLIQTLVARHRTVGVVPAYLIGYRRLPSAMSADRVRMCRSQLEVLAILARSYPDVPKAVLAPAIALVETNLAAGHLMQNFDVANTFAALLRAVRQAPEATAREVVSQLRVGFRRHVAGRLSAQPGGRGADFLELDPEDGSARRDRLGWLLDRIASKEDAFARSARQLDTASVTPASCR